MHRFDQRAVQKQKPNAKFSNQRFYSQVKITSQTQPDASPSVGLRLVGLLPCAVWSPKISKPTIGQIQRVQASPYTVSTASSIRSAAFADPSTSTHPSTNRLFTLPPPPPPPLHQQHHQHQRSEPSSTVSSCRCNSTHSHSLSAVEHLYSNQISTIHQSTSAGSITTIAPINQQAVTTVNRKIESRPISSTTTSTATNPMLLVPFTAMPSGFVPIQGGQIPVVAPATLSTSSNIIRKLF